jgi:hypothetical protein
MRLSPKAAILALRFVSFLEILDIISTFPIQH